MLLFAAWAESQFTAYAYDHARTVAKPHGRIEVRQGWTITYPTHTGSLRAANHWRGLTTFVKVRTER